ncbi:MAG: HD family phosphohydrolase [Syntrophobacteraceae bacterium]
MDKEKKEPEKQKLIFRVLKFKKFLPSILQNSVYQKILILIGLSLIISALLGQSFTANVPRYMLGDVADRNIKASQDHLIEDEEATSRKREEATRHSPVVYNLDEYVEQQVLDRLAAAFQLMRNYSQDAGQDTKEALLKDKTPDQANSTDSESASELPDALQLFLQKKKEFANPLGIQIPDEVFNDILDRKFSSELQDKVSQLLKSIFDKGIVSGKAWQMRADSDNLVVRKAGSNDESIIPPPHSYLDIEEARKFAMMQAFELGGDIKEMRAIAFLASQLLQPNLTYNINETEKRREQAYASVKPVFIQIMKNEMLVREGQRIGPEELLKLKAFDHRKGARSALIIFIALFLFSGVCICVVVQVTKQHLPLYRMEVENLLFLGILLILLLAIGRSAVWVADFVGEGASYVSGKTIIYSIPLSAGAMMASIFFGVTLSFIFSMLTTLFVGILLGGDFGLYIYFLIGSFVAAHAVSPCRNRMVPIKAGLLVGCTNVVLIALGSLVQNQLALFGTLTNVFFGFSGGVFAGILVTGLTPLAEMIFGYTTDIKLLELATMDQPLLRELMVQAPGTYHHSIVVGSMVEAAANSIGANPLLAKVAGYYHDIGKTRKPIYFIENQFDTENRHEKLAPSMSSLILISHVKEGVELAKQHRLGKDLINIISQHHGKSFISFFYNKAVEQREKAKTQSAKGADLPPINMDDYRYPGPKPQTKEAGLVMLADVVEAACRSLTEPTPARIQGMVSRLINNVFIDGQLDECELTLKDLHLMAKHFNQILATVHHKRIEYPATPTNDVKGKADVSDPNQREPKSGGDKPYPARESGRKDLKRLGIH